MIVGIDGNEANVKNRVGSGQYGFELLKQFAKIKTDNQFLVYLKNRPLLDLPNETPNFKYLVFGPKKFWTQVALPVNLYFRKPRPSVFFTPTHYAPRFSPVPVVITIFDLSFIHFPEMFRKSDLYQLKNWTAYSVKKAAKILTISQSSKADIVNYYQVPENKVIVTYPGVGSEFKPQPREKIEAIKKKYGIKNDYILYVGTLQPRKNLLCLIEAFYLLIRNAKYKIQNTKLVIAGKKGWLYDEIFAKVKNLELENKVIFTDFVESQDLPALYSGAAVFVNVSLWEGFGMPVLEAAACGTPVVVSNTSSLPEVVGDAGILVNPESVEDIAVGISKALRYHGLVHGSIENKLLQQAAKFSWESCAVETLKVLESVNS